MLEMCLSVLLQMIHCIDSAVVMAVILRSILGVVSITSLLGVVLVTAHLAGAALLWAHMLALKVVA